MNRQFLSGRATYAQYHRQPGTRRSSARAYAIVPGDNVIRHTFANEAWQAPVIVEEYQSAPAYFVESNRVPGRYYALRQLSSGKWFFSGDDSLISQYVAKVQRYLADQDAANVA